MQPSFKIYQKLRERKNNSNQKTIDSKKLRGNLLI